MAMMDSSTEKSPQPHGEDTAAEAAAGPQGDAPVQYYSRSEMPHREVSLHPFSLKRKSTLIVISLAAAIVLSLATVFLRDSGLSAVAAAALAFTVFIMVRAGPRIIALEFWIRRMGAGDLNHQVRPQGNDEITEIAYDLEVLRRRSMRAQQLDLIQGFPTVAEKVDLGTSRLTPVIRPSCRETLPSALLLN